MSELCAMVVIPTYNEIESLPPLVEAIFSQAPQVQILVVDDGSPDGTGQWAKEQAGEDNRLKVLQRSEKGGLGRAYLAAFEHIKTHFPNVDLIIEMDADGSHRPVDLPKIIACANDVNQPDLVIGSRWVPGGAVSGWAKRREFLSRGGNRYVRLMLGMPVSDATAGFRAWRTSILARMDLEKVESKGYGFQVEMTWRAHRKGAQIAEVPILFVERAAGTSKMSGSIIKEAFFKVASWRFGEIFKK